MANDPISGARYALETDSGDVALWLQRAVNDISSQVVPRFASTGARDTAYAAAITAGTIASIANGSVCMANGVPYRRINGTWREDRDRFIIRTVTPSAPANSIVSGGASETGVTSGATALANFTLYEAATVMVNATFRAGIAVGGSGTTCNVKIDGAVVGDTAVERYDGTSVVVGAVALASGSHSISFRVAASGATIGWTSAYGVLHIGGPE